MADSALPVEIPNRTLFKAAEVCELARLQPYVLRSWEAEFPALGVARGSGGSRVYRRSDVEQVLRIKHLLLVEGLTLAGARRRLAEELTPVGVNEPALDELIGRHARERLTEVKRGLRSILELLAGRAGLADVRAGLSQASPGRAGAGGRARPSHGRPSAARGAARARRKRSA
jgi:DNA-binding transcriptional MerR regulator